MLFPIVWGSRIIHLQRETNKR